MKELQNFVYRHMDALRHHKRYLAMLTALSMLVTFIVPLILIEPADSMTKQRLMLLSDTSNMAMVSNLNNGQDGNNGNSKGQLSEVTLLIGEFTPGDYETKLEWVEGCTTAAEVVEAAKREYFLGIASDFCVFLNENFTITNSDAEGRVAVGGTVNFKNANDGWNYQIGNGDYGSGTDLKDTDNYKGISNFAHLITAGYVQGINTVSVSKAYDDAYKYNDFYKRFVIGSNADLSDTTKFYHKGNNAYNTACKHNSMDINETACFYGADLIDFDETFLWLEEQSEKLSRKTANGTVSFNSENTILTLDGQNREADTIYFDLDEWKTSIKRIEFINVPDDANLVINCGSTIVSIDDIDDTDNNGSESYNNLIRTSINGVEINNKGTEAEKYTSNNHKKSEQILYNFYNAEKVHIDVNFNGTIFAPKADVFSGNVKADGTYGEECNGHLSGSLIAKSFTGGLEFGYRPYRGGTDILGSTAGYVVPFDKFTQDGKTFLPGATFVIIDETGKIVESWTSGEGTQYITLPSELDLEGGTDYTAADAVTSITHSYTVEEQSAPEGYIKTDEFYTIVITETIDTSPDALIRTESGTLPTRILVYLDLYKGEAEEGNLLGRRVVTIEDTYSDEGIIQRIVCIENESGKQYFVLDINFQDGSIKSVGVPTDSSVLEDDEVESVFDDMKVNYLKPEVLEDEETGDGTDGEGTDDSTEGEKSLFPEGYVEPTGLTATYGQTLSQITIPSQDGIGSWTWVDNGQNVGDVGTKTFRATFIPTVEGYTQQEVQLQITVEPATPTPPGPYTVSYGTYLYNIQLPSDANGLWSWVDSNQTGNNLNTFSFQAKYTPNNNNYKAISVDVSVTFTKSDPSYNLPNNLTATYGQTLADVTLPYADNGTWSWQADPKTSVGSAGTNTFVAVFTPNDTNYNTVTHTVQITVNKADPNYTVPTGLTVTYGSKLSSVTLPSGWTWDAPDNDVPGSAGSTVNYSATFTPSDTNNYNIINEDITLTIVQATPTVNPVYDKEKTYTQFDALPAISITEGDTPGTIQWSDKNASKLKYGENVLEWVFTPTDSTNYETVTGTITITAEAIKTTPITITDSKTEEVIKYNNVDYYYDPTSMMIMPLPDETPKFINEYGLVFKKLDDNGNLLPGASISLQSGTITEEKWVENTELSKPTWDWENGTSSSATIPVTEIKVNELNVGVVYRFLETAAPSEDYEIAEPIYFMKVDDSTIIYTQNEDDLANTAAWIELNLNEGEYIIGMTDRGIYGAEITLVKTNKNGVKLDGAEFELYAVGAKSDVLVYPLNDGEYFEFKNGEVNLYEWFNSVDPSTYNSEYVQNGYLKPGGYYLYEVNPPSQAYERPDGPLYFTVEERTDADGKTYYEVTADKTEVADYVPITLSFDTNVSGNVYKNTFVVDHNGNTLNVGNWNGSVGFANVEYVFIKSSAQPKFWRNDSEGAVSFTYDAAKEGYIANFDPATNLSKIEIQHNSDWNTGLEVSYVEIGTSDGTIYSTAAPNQAPADYDINSITISPTPSYYRYTEKVDVSDGKDATISAGSDYANKQITKIEFDISENKNGWGGIQIKPNQSQIAAISPSGGNTYTYPENGSINTSLKFDSSGNFYFTWWHYVIDEIRFYIEGAETSTGKPDLSIETLKVYYLDGTNQTYSSLTAGDTANGDGSYPFDISALTNRNDIVGMEVTLTGTGTGNIKIGDAWTISGAKAGSYTVGVTDYKPETSVEDGDTSHLVNASGTTLTIKNEAQGQETNIIVKKSWVNDADFTQYRPSEIEVKLYRGTKADGSDKVYIGDINDDESLANFNGTVTLNASNNWQHAWEDLPSAYAYEKKEDGSDDFDKPIRYYYFAVETTVPDRYTVSYPTQGSTSGDYTITNTLDTINIPVEKKWKNSDGSPAIPNVNTITVKLQKDNGSGYSDFLDKDGNPVTLVLSSDNNWLGEFTGIPEGEYQVVESVVPSGWTESRVTEKGKTIITNTQKTGALKLTKIWQNDEAIQRPQDITIRIYRTTTRSNNNNNNGSGGGTTGGGNNVDAIPPENSKHETVTEDYARLLQYSLYFYDANMCGDEVTENSVIDWRDNCHTDDAVVGGFHDAGDHAVFGLPQGYTASTLGWSYYEFKDSFDTLGLTEHYKLIMKEFCDFFVASTTLDSNKNVINFLYQKGNGNTDHSYWGPPEYQSSRQNEMFTTTYGASEIAAQYAAALALYAINFGDPGNYIEVAEALYAFSTDAQKGNKLVTEIDGNGHSNFYDSSSYKDDQAWAAGWLYIATNKSKYETDCKNLTSINKYWTYCWDEVSLGAAAVLAHITNDWSDVNKHLEEVLKVSSTAADTLVIPLGGMEWGSLRYNTAIQMIALASAKNSDKNYEAWCQSQMSFILGNNDKKVCFVTGFDDASVKNPHHRAASGYSNSEYNKQNTFDSDGHTLVGALAGGPKEVSCSSYQDDMQDYTQNEVALDYNASLVGAAAGLYEVYKTGNTVVTTLIPGVETAYASAASISIGDIMNTSAMSFKRNAVSVLADGSRYTIIDTVTVNKTLSKNGTYNLNNINYINVNLIEVEFEYTNANQYNDRFQGYVSCNSVNDWDKTYSLSTGNLVFSLSLNEATTISYVKVYDNGRGDDADTVKIKEIRFYKEKTGPTVTITNAPTTALKIGVPHQLSASGVDSIGWRSSSEKVSVDNGNVIINEYPENGKVTITAYDTTNQDTKAEVTINVEALSLTPPSSNVVIGDKVVYNANYDGFTIEDKDGYSVNEKEVTATNTGNYTVSATYAGSSATASLNVAALQITNLVTPLGVNATHTFGVNGDIEGHTFEWISSDSTVLSFDENVPGLATTHKSGNVKIKVIKDGKYESNEYDVAVQKGALSISVQPTQIRVGDTAELSAVNTESQTVRYSWDPDFITISGNIITAKNVENQETVVITGTLGDESATCNLTIIPLPSITAPNGNTEEYILGIDQTLQLTASNILGTATWTSSNESVVVFEENVSGSNTIAIRSITNGESTITVTDTDGTTGTFKIFVKEIAVEPDIPEGLVMYKQVTLSAANLTQDGTWVITENLPLEDERGRKYYYYIKEETVNDVVNGNGGKYIPISYSDNGFTLDENTVKEVSVTNKLTETIQGQLPSTGGSGAKTYYYFGGALMLLGIAGFTGLKRRERKRRKE